MRNTENLRFCSANVQTRHSSISNNIYCMKEHHILELDYYRKEDSILELDYKTIEKFKCFMKEFQMKRDNIEHVIIA